MINRLPRWLPTFAELIEDLGLRPETHPAVARALGVSERTIRRWIAGKAPRVARLSLWWLSRYGYSARGPKHYDTLPRGRRPLTPGRAAPLSRHPC